MSNDLVNNLKDNFMFLPEDYKSPSSQNNYMKLIEGENKFRILSAPILGWEDWDNKTPRRFRFNQKPLTSVDPKKPVRHFWAFVVWNYRDEKIQILHLTQATIRKAIENLAKDADWGAPFFYDIKIIKTGEGTDTDYTVNPLPMKEIHPFIVEQFYATPCYLEALFENADPFDKKWANPVQGVFKKDDLTQEVKIINTKIISSEQCRVIKDLILQDENSDEAIKILLMKCSASSISEILTEKFDAAYAWISKRLEKQKELLNEVPF